MSESLPILVCGMHRSGTSLAASLLARCGVRLGEEMIPADGNNPRGYFEDAEVVRLHQEMFAAATRGGEGGHPDWGWTEDESFDNLLLDEYGDRAAAIVADRAAGPGPWGFKDPRTTVALELWDRELAGRARYVFVYRAPWEVADSMQRLGAEVFLRHPEYALRIWHFYNRRILAFRRRHPERCLLLSTNAIIERPESVSELVEARFGLAAVSDTEGVLRRDEIAAAPGDDPIARWTLDAYPDVRELWRRLEDAADLPSPGSGVPAPPAATEEPAPVVSVVIPCLDHGELLLVALASVERTVDVPYEVVVVDDGSTAPETLRILDHVRAAGYRIHVQENRGLAAARNRGIELARGRYLLALDADNRIRPGFVARAVEVLDASPDIGVVYGDRQEFGLRSGRIAVGPFDLPRILWNNYIDACAVFRRTVWAEAGGYDEALEIYEDWAFWIAAGGAGWRFHHLDQVALDYRVRPGSLVTAAYEPDVNRRVRERILERHGDLYRRHAADVVRHGWHIDR